ncbi:hypothetical protein IQ607_002878 [Salmonella enterica]|nr:hypothetical protein [Salmonella enterica]EBT1279367.1 hypothetical protein [Salmonella enterica]EGL5072761.1 hypothetical protein [Salmonella enterica]MIV19623.1 hypothetical protein [Salmonella enterica]
MSKNTYPDRENEAIKTLMFALIEISCIAETAHEHACRESECAGSVIPYSLAIIQRSTEQALQDVSNIMSKGVADSEITQGVSRD